MASDSMQSGDRLCSRFYVDKKTGKTRVEEFVPALDITQEAGSINLFDYVKE